METGRDYTKIIATDFDGTLCRNAFPEIGEPTRYLQKAIEEKKNGAAIILWTCRKGKHLEDAVDWCIEHGLRIDAVNANLPRNIQLFGGIDTRKVYADEYWDDKAVAIGGVEKGEWEERYIEDSDIFFRRRFYCSECGNWNTYGMPPYCPYCGVRMKNCK